MAYGVLARVVAALLPREQENQATEALLHILECHPGAQAVVVDFLSAVDPALRGANLAAYSQIVDTKTGARPDVRFVDPRSGELRALLEVKLEAGLTENQPVGYVRQLHGRGPLVFLVPSRRQDVVWSEVVDRLKRAGLVEQMNGDAGKRLCTADGTTVGLVTWQNLLTAIRTALPANDDLANSDLEQLSGLVRYSEDASFVPFTAEELTDVRWARRWRDYCRILDKSINALLSDADISFRSDTSGRRLKVMGGDAWYFSWFHVQGVWGRLELNARYWEYTGRSPYHLAFQPGGRSSEIVRGAVGGRAREQPPGFFTNTDGWHLVPLRVPSGASEDVVVAAVSDGVREVVRAIVDEVASRAGESPVNEPPPAGEIEEQTDAAEPST